MSSTDSSVGTPSRFPRANGGQRRVDNSQIVCAHGFTISLPDGWENQTMYRLENNETGGIAPQISVAVRDGVGEKTAIDLAGLHLRTQNMAAPSSSVLSDGFLDLNYGGRGYWVTISGVTDGRPRIVQDQLHVVEEGTGYRMTVLQVRDRRSASRDTVKRLFKSFEPTPS